MGALKKYTGIGLVVVVIILVVALFIFKSQKDNAIEKLDRANEQINQLINANISLKGSIDLLEQQSEQNRSYITELETKKSETLKEASNQVQQFKAKKHESKTINNWADQPLPDGLY